MKTLRRRLDDAFEVFYRGGPTVRDHGVTCARVALEMALEHEFEVWGWPGSFVDAKLLRELLASLDASQEGRGR